MEEQARVRVLVHDWRKAIWVSRAAVELVQGDIRNRDLVAEAIEGCEIVFHCVGVGGTMNECVSVNIEGTRNVLECAMNAGVSRVVYLSTSVVHGPNPPNNADETRRASSLPVLPMVTPRSLRRKLVSQFWHERRLPVVIIRPDVCMGSQVSCIYCVANPVHETGSLVSVDGGPGHMPRALYR